MSKRSKLDIVVGFLSMLGLAAIAFLALKAANLASFSEADTYRVTARFDNIGGLKRRAPVRSSGVVVGRVASIELDGRSFQSIVAMDLKRGVVFPRDSSARIQTAGLLGDQYIGLDAGADSVMLAAGDAIAHTQSALVLEQMLGQLLFSGAADEADTPPATTGSKR